MSDFAWCGLTQCFDPFLQKFLKVLSANVPSPQYERIFIIVLIIITPYTQTLKAIFVIELLGRFVRNPHFQGDPVCTHLLGMMNVIYKQALTDVQTAIVRMHRQSCDMGFFTDQPESRVANETLGLSIICNKIIAHRIVQLVYKRLVRPVMTAKRHGLDVENILEMFEHHWSDVNRCASVSHFSF